jgi:hypothetical protein
MSILVAQSDFMQVVKRDGDFRKNYGLLIGACLYAFSLRAVSGRSFPWTGWLLAAFAAGAALALRKECTPYNLPRVIISSKSIDPTQDIDALDRLHEHVRLEELCQLSIRLRPLAPPVAKIIDENDIGRQPLEILDQPLPLQRHIAV